MAEIENDIEFGGNQPEFNKVPDMDDMGYEDNTESLSKKLNQEVPIQEPEPQYEEAASEYQEDEPEPEEYESEVHRKTKGYDKVRVKERIGRLTREKYEMQYAYEQAMQELNTVRQQNELYNDVIQKSKDSEVSLMIDKYERLKREAKESGDIDQELNADRNLSRALAYQKELDDYKARQDYLARMSQQQQQYQQQQYQQFQQSPPMPSAEKQYMVREWLDNREFLDDESDGYDPKIGPHVNQEILKYNQILQNQGLGHMIGTKEYLSEIDRYVANLRPQNAPRQRENLNMGAPRGGVSPVRSSAQRGGASSKREVKLSREKLDFIKSYGGTPESYLNKEREIEIQKQGHKY